MSSASGPRPAQTTVTIIDPKILAAIAEVKADTQEIKAKLTEDHQPIETPRYFPRGYFP